MRHAIEEEEKVPMEHVTNFQEVMFHRPGEIVFACPACRLASFSSVFVTYLLGPDTDDTGSLLVWLWGAGQCCGHSE